MPFDVYVPEMHYYNSKIVATDEQQLILHQPNFVSPDTSQAEIEPDDIYNKSLQQTDEKPGPLVRLNQTMTHDGQQAKGKRKSAKGKVGDSNAPKLQGAEQLWFTNLVSQPKIFLGGSCAQAKLDTFRSGVKSSAQKSCVQKSSQSKSRKTPNPLAKTMMMHTPTLSSLAAGISFL